MDNSSTALPFTVIDIYPPVADPSEANEQKVELLRQLAKILDQDDG